MKHTLVALMAASVAGLAHAEDTLTKLKNTGVVTLGVRESSGLSYTIGGGQFVGYHIDICTQVVADLEKRLGRKLEIKYQPVTSQNRVPLVKNGTVDLECGSTTNNRARQKDVAFAVTTFVEEVRIAVKVTSDISSVHGLAGKTVATTTGTTSVQTLRKLSRSSGLSFNEIFGKDHADSFLMLESGRADAFVMDGSILARSIATSKRPSDFKLVGEALSVEPIAIMMRKDDPDFKNAVDDSIKAQISSGQVASAYERWFQKPIPPAGIVMNLALNASTQQAWAHPNDKPTEDYQSQSAAGTKRSPEGGILGGAWDWQVFLRDTGGGRTYLDWLLSAWGWTMAVSLLALAVALAFGTAAGLLRTLPRRGLAWAGGAWTEVFRNIPLLVQLFLWYHVLPTLFPALQAMPSFLLVVLALGLFTSARISEQVKAGIEALPRGQKWAGLSVGLTLPQTYRYVLLPMAFRVVIPPLTSESMNIVKNSAVAFAVSVSELTLFAMQAQEETSRGVEIYLAVTALYFISAFALGRIGHFIEQRTRLPGMVGGQP